MVIVLYDSLRPKENRARSDGMNTHTIQYFFVSWDALTDSGNQMSIVLREEAVEYGTSLRCLNARLEGLAEDILLLLLPVLI